MKTFKEYMTGTDFETYFDIDLLPEGRISERGGECRGLIHIYRDYIGTNMMMRRYLVDAWMDYFRGYLVEKIDNESDLVPIR